MTDQINKRADVTPDETGERPGDVVERDAPPDEPATEQEPTAPATEPEDE